MALFDEGEVIEAEAGERRESAEDADGQKKVEGGIGFLGEVACGDADQEATEEVDAHYGPRCAGVFCESQFDDKVAQDTSEGSS